ncbi:MAG: GDSL-type esterase/lipase family protein [Acidobacteria bacterium]|nr:GDSL-type esterase/lipase family protein [Acidobacteriota bacterium]
MSSAAAETTPVAVQARPQWLRRVLQCICIGLWIGFLAMMLHTSRDPAVFGRYSREYVGLMLGVGSLAVLTCVLQTAKVAAYFWANRLAIAWFFVFCPLLIGVCVEVAMRTFNLLGSNFYDEIRRYTRQLARDEKLYFRNPSSYEGRYQGVDLQTNAMGLRERPISSKQPGRPRILMLGDSVLFGWGVRVEDTCSRQLENLLHMQRGIDAEIINSGVPGYNSYQEMVFLKTRGGMLEPDAVVLLYVDNDIDPIDPAHPHLGVRPDPRKDPSGAFDYYASVSRFYFMLRHLIPALLSSTSTSVQAARGSFGWRQSMESIAAAGRYSRAHHLPFMLVQFRMTPGALGDALRADLQPIAVREGFAYADSLPWFDGSNIRHLTNSFVDTHPNAQGQRVIAAGIERLLISEGVLSASRRTGAAPR